MAASAVEDIIRKHVLWACGAGLVPVPFLDLVAVTAIQQDMLRQLCSQYSINYAESDGKLWVSGLTGSLLARLGANAIKLIPGIGSLIGGVSMAAMSGASTYAMGRVAVHHFESGGSLRDLDMNKARKKYEEEFEKGKDYAKEVSKNQDAQKASFEKLEKLGQLKEKGVITQEEFETQKKKILDAL